MNLELNKLTGLLLWFIDRDNIFFDLSIVSTDNKRTCPFFNTEDTGFFKNPVD